MVLHFFTGPGHRHRIQRETRCPKHKQRRGHCRLTKHRQTSQNDHKDLYPQHQQATVAVCQAPYRPLAEDPRTHHHRHPEADAGVADALMVQPQRHQAIQRAEDNPRNNTAIDPVARLA